MDVGVSLSSHGRNAIEEIIKVCLGFWVREFRVAQDAQPSCNGSGRDVLGDDVGAAFVPSQKVRKELPLQPFDVGPAVDDPAKSFEEGRVNVFVDWGAIRHV